MVREQMALIQDVQTDEWWQDVTVPMLERRGGACAPRQADREAAAQADLHRLRGRDGHRDRVALPGFADGTDSRSSGRRRGRSCARTRTTSPIHKLRLNKPLTPQRPRGAGANAGGERRRRPDDIRGPRRRTKGWAVRPVAGRPGPRGGEGGAGRFLAGRTLTANQIEFVNLIVDHLTEHGVMDPARLYESPFTDLTPQGPEGFSPPRRWTNCGGARKVRQRRSLRNTGRSKLRRTKAVASSQPYTHLIGASQISPRRGDGN